MKYGLNNLRGRSESSCRYTQFCFNSLKLTLAAALIVTVSACGSSGSDGGGTPSGPTAESPLSGTWEQCRGGLKSMFTFTSNTWAEKNEVYQNENCVGEVFSDFGIGGFAGSYEVIGNSTSESGLPVMQLKMTSETLDGVAVLESAKVTRYNIVYTGTQNQLVLGEFSGSENSIPTQLNFEEPYLLR